MRNRHVIRVVLSGQTPMGTRESFWTTVSASADDCAAGRHVEQAMFRAGVRGLEAPWEVIEVSTVSALAA